jgi:hypothetical protein
MGSVHASNVVDRGVEPWWGQTTEYNIGICCFSVKHAALKRNIKDMSARNQDNVSERGDLSTRGLLF